MIAIMTHMPGDPVTLLSMLLNVALLIGWFTRWMFGRDRSCSGSSRHRNLRSRAGKSSGDSSESDPDPVVGDVGSGTIDFGCSRSECDAMFKEVSRQYQAHHGRLPEPLPFYQVRGSPTAKLHLNRSCYHIKDKNAQKMLVCEHCFHESAPKRRRK